MLLLTVELGDWVQEEHQVATSGSAIYIHTQGSTASMTMATKEEMCKQ